MRLSAPTFSASFFFFNDTATTEIYTLSLHDALPTSTPPSSSSPSSTAAPARRTTHDRQAPGPLRDRKSTRLNSSHVAISYAVFCLKKTNSSNNHYNVKSQQKKKHK